MDMDKIKTILGASILLLVSVQVNAAIIDMGDYQLDGNTGMQWLDLTLTTGLSVNDALSIYSSSGWKLATESQFDQMYANYDGGPLDSAVHGFGGPIYTHRYSALGYESINIQSPSRFSQWYKQNSFIQDFGLTKNNIREFDRWGYPSDYEKASRGYYRSDLGERFLSLGGVYMAVSANPLTWDHLNSYYDYIEFERDFDIPLNVDRGLFLVRGSPVPEPSIIALFALGLFGIGFVRRRQKS
jgi:hypothetical protein